jgi:uncharacterized membrane protein YsdA (DUF1294 family)
MGDAVRHGVLGMVLALGAATALCWFLGFGTSPTGLAMAYLLSINFVTFAYFGLDKMQARRQGRRIPEAVLHGLSLVGGSIGALAAMRFFRHKTLKTGFQVILWLLVILQIAIVALICWSIGSR